jgi:hypothetical protein
MTRCDSARCGAILGSEMAFTARCCQKDKLQRKEVSRLSKVSGLGFNISLTKNLFPSKATTICSLSKLGYSLKGA